MRFNLTNILLLLSITTATFAQITLNPTNIGININDPESSVSLHIKDNFEAIRLDGTSPFISFYNGADYRGYLYMTGDNMYLFNRKNGRLFFGVNDNSKLTINAAGDVGIGTLIPDHKLHVADGGLSGATFNSNTIAGFEKGSGNGYLSILTSSSTEKGILFGDETSSVEGGIIYNNGGTPDGLQFRTNGNITRVSIDNAGDVGIGKGNPGRPLDIKSRNGGDEYGIRIERSSSAINWEMSVFQGNFNFFYNGGTTPVATIATNGNYSASDRRLKKDIQPYRSVLSLISKLDIKTYRYKNDDVKLNPGLGLIAQDVEPLFPEIVRIAPDRNDELYYSLDYSKTGVIALKGIQELQKIISVLNDDNASLKAHIDNLERENRLLWEELEKIKRQIGISKN